MTDLDKLLKEMKARCDASTEGPWGYYAATGEGESLISYKQRKDGSKDLNKFIMALFPRKELDYKNIEFIAHARTDMPRLIEAVAFLRNELMEYEGSRDLNATNEIVIKILKGEEEK